MLALDVLSAVSEFKPADFSGIARAFEPYPTCSVRHSGTSSHCRRGKGAATDDNVPAETAVCDVPGNPRDEMNEGMRWILGRREGGRHHSCVVHRAGVTSLTSARSPCGHNANGRPERRICSGHRPCLRRGLSNGAADCIRQPEHMGCRKVTFRPPEKHRKEAQAQPE